MGTKVQESHNPITNVNNHGLIKLLVYDALSEEERRWNSLFLEEHEEGSLEKSEEHLGENLIEEEEPMQE